MPVDSTKVDKATLNKLRKKLPKDWGNTIADRCKVSIHQVYRVFRKQSVDESVALKVIAEATDMVEYEKLKAKLLTDKIKETVK